jgi:hypothetical protein
MPDDLAITFTTPLDDTQTARLKDVLRALPRARTLMLRCSSSDGKVIANFGGDAIAEGDDVASAVGAAYTEFLKTVRLENLNRKAEPSYVQPNLRRPLAGDTIPWGALPSHVKKKEPTT